MTNPRHDALATELWNARKSGTVVTTDKQPASLATAYELQEAVTQVSGRKILGYKLGATTDAALELLDLGGPFAGPLLDGFCHKNEHKASVQMANNPGIESEFVLGIAQDLPYTGSLSESEVAQAVAWVAGGFLANLINRGVIWT